jgi:hypothetical protein
VGGFSSYVYGGNTNSQGLLDDMWVLSLPGFQWFKIDVQSPRRFGHTCALAGKSQIIVVGGGETDDDSAADPWPQGLNVFDLSTLQWASSFNPDADEYEPPDFIREWYEDG